MGKLTRKTTRLDHQGMVSITVTVIFIMVISLTVLGFSEVTRRNNREALDRQLSAAALTAADSAVNDVMNKIAKLVETGKDIPEQGECRDDDDAADDTSGYTRNGGVVDSAVSPNVLYTCLLVDPTPSKLEYGNVGEGSVVIPLNTDLPTIDFQTLTWKPAASAPPSADVTNCPAVSSNIPALKWQSDCPYGLLRVDIIPVITLDPGSTIKSPEDAARATMTVFFYPRSGGALPDIPYEASAPNVYGTGAPQGLVKAAKCNATSCEAKISNLSFPNAYMRVRSLYVSTPNFQVAIGSGSYERSQVVVDVTGKAEDVLRRVRVRLSMSGGSSRTDINGFSDYSLMTTDSLCKRYSTAPNYVSQDINFTCPD